MTAVATLTYADEPCTCGAQAVALVLDARGHVVRGACTNHVRTLGRDQLRPGHFTIQLAARRKP